MPAYVFMLSIRAWDAAFLTFSASAFLKGATADETFFATNARYSDT